VPYPPPPRFPSGPRRRTLLVSVAGGALVAGCSAGSGDSEEGTGGSPSVTEQTRVRAARDSQGLAERYDAVLGAYPALAERLEPLRAEVVRHTEAFGGVRKPSAPASASPSPSASAPPAVPGGEKDAVATLAAAERALADRRAKALLGVEGELARLLASVAAAGAAHAYLLTEGAR
jgi:hypothetical protein